MNSMHKFRILVLSVLFLGAVAIQEKSNAQPGVSISFQTFYRELSPYGRWINTPQYGSVWTPYADAGFQPYSTNGYWEVTEYGNTWVSDYDWGWAPFHYGRWSFDDYNGWFWIPGYEWGPAWVNWRSGGGYYGWAPLGPGVNVNISINVPSFWWVFVPQQYITTRSWHSFSAPRGRYNTIYNRTTIINNYYNNDNRTYVYGPRRDEIERVTRRSVVVRDIDRSRRGAVIIDHSSDRSPSYTTPGGNRSGYDNNRRDTGPYTSPGNGNNNYRSNSGSYEAGRDNYPASRNERNNTPSYPSNTRPVPDRGYAQPGDGVPNYNRSGSQQPAQNNDSRQNRSYDTGTPVQSPERDRSSTPSENSGRSRDYGNPATERPANTPSDVRTNSSERNSRGTSQPAENRSYDNSGGGSRSERGGRSPR